MQTTQIYIPLTDEAAYSPTQAIILANGFFEVLVSSDYDPEAEIWEFLPGSIVRCEEREHKGKRFLLAVEKIG